MHVGPDGAVRATYRKVHLFDVEVDGVVYRESDHEAPGDEPVLTEVRGAGVGLAICYDLRFPELFRVLALRGARLFTLPSAFTVPTTRDHWEVLVRARAIEDQAFVVAANQIGEHAPGPAVGRALAHRRPLGRRPGLRARRRDASSWPTSTSAPRTRSARGCPRWPGAGRRPTR